MRRILVVDDEQAISQVLHDLLADEGYEVLTAGNGREALVNMADGRPDLVLSDVMMPVMDGAELCRALASDARYGSIPVVLMSAAGERAAGERGTYAAFVAKPFNLLDILDTVERLLGDVAGQ